MARRFRMVYLSAGQLNCAETTRHFGKPIGEAPNGIVYEQERLFDDRNK